MFKPVLNIYIANQADWDLLVDSNNYDNYCFQNAQILGSKNIKKVFIFVGKDFNQVDKKFIANTESLRSLGLDVNIQEFNKPIEQCLLSWRKTFHILVQKNLDNFETYQSIIDNSFLGRFNQFRIFTIDLGILFSKDMIRTYELSDTNPRPL